MKSRQLIALFILALGFASHAYSQVYTWVDENGKKHFGDTVPEKYREQSEDISAEVSNKANVTEPVKKRDPLYPSSQTNKTSQAQDDTQQNSSNNAALQGNSCKAQWARFRASEACFASCARRVAGGGRDTTNCDDCEDQPRPTCTE